MNDLASTYIVGGLIAVVGVFLVLLQLFTGFEAEISASTVLLLVGVGLVAVDSELKKIRNNLNK